MATQHIFQVSELTKKVRFILESELNTVWLCGEISNFIAASSGHWYLSLKDSKSQVKCAMFKGNNRRVRIQPRNGQQVLVRARVSLYEPRGDFQLIIEQMEDEGDGLLRQQYELLKSKLTQEGVFDHRYKQQIPESIRRVGIVTSPTGAAVRDIISVINRRNAGIEIIVYPSLVQGETAAVQVAQMINIANQRNECDVLIVGRGGGSLEDLWCFNEEPTVRAIFDSAIPVISAVGHEVDTTLSDYVADLRAPTPSAAAELVSTNTQDLMQKLSVYHRRLQVSFAQILTQKKQQYNNLYHRLSQVHPKKQLEFQQQRVDELELRLKRAQTANITQKHQFPEQLKSRLLQQSPLHTISSGETKSQQLHQRLKLAIQNRLQSKEQVFKQTIEQLHIVSPLATIARGYSVSRTSSGKIIKSIEQVNENEEFSVQVADGTLLATLQEKHSKE